jgi:hypothetical protein
MYGYSDNFKFALSCGKINIDHRLLMADITTPFSYYLFKTFPIDMCYLLFDDYIEHHNIKDSIYATAIKAILLNKSNPSSIFQYCSHCLRFSYHCSYPYIHFVYLFYDFETVRDDKLKTYDSNLLLDFNCFKEVNIYDILDNM